MALSLAIAVNEAPQIPDGCFPCKAAVYGQPVSVDSEPDFLGHSRGFERGAHYKRA
jgi:hypothetical protein